VVVAGLALQNVFDLGGRRHSAGPSDAPGTSVGCRRCRRRQTTRGSDELQARCRKTLTAAEKRLPGRSTAGKHLRTDG
jgi:hypothetical protein